MECAEKDIRMDLLPPYRWLKKWKYDVKAYNRGEQLNVKDRDGIIQSFYPTTGTILLRVSNDRNNGQSYTLTEQELIDFVHILNNTNIAKNRIKEKYEKE